MVDLVEKETAESTFQIYRIMLRMDKIVIFVLGKVERELVKRKLEVFGFTYINPKLEFEYHQEY
ncbi:insulinase family protein, partial [Streptococcus suis]